MNINFTTTASVVPTIALSETVYPEIETSISSPTTLIFPPAQLPLSTLYLIERTDSETVYVTPSGTFVNVIVSSCFTRISTDAVQLLPFFLLFK